MMRVRFAVEGDEDALRHLWHERMVILSQSDERFRASLDAEMPIPEPPEEPFLVVEDEGAIVGLMRLAVRDHSGLILDMALDAHRYHSGAGRALVMAARDYLREQGAQRIVVRVPRYHPVEQAFWLALGAKEWTNSTWETPPEMGWMLWLSDLPK